MPGESAGDASTVPVRCSEQIVIGCPAGLVWSLVTDPAAVVLVQDDAVRGFTVSGTPAGAVGEQKCTIVRRPDGTLAGLLIEVIELEPGRRSVHRSLSAPISIQVETTVLPVDKDTCVLRMAAVAITRLNRADTVRRVLRSENVNLLARYRDAAESRRMR